MFEKVSDMKYIECVIREIVIGCGVFTLSVGVVALIMTALWLCCLVLS